MTLHTIVPYEQLLKGIDQIAAPQELIYLGQKVLVSPLPEPGEFQLVQLISSDPQLFLHPELQPGTVIRYPACKKAN